MDKGIGIQTFTCRVGVVFHLDCGMLIGWDCPILAQLLRRIPMTPHLKAEKTLQAEARGLELPVHQEESAWITRDDPSLRFALGYGPRTTSPSTEKAPTFSLDQGVLYRWVEGKSQLVVPGPLRSCPWPMTPPPPWQANWVRRKHLTEYSIASLGLAFGPRFTSTAWSVSYTRARDREVGQCL